MIGSLRQGRRAAKASASEATVLRARTEPVADEAALVLDGIARRFGGRWILRGCSLALRSGEGVALVGSNGAGKTTLLRIIATLLRPNRGAGRVFGLDLLREAGSIRELIGYMGFAPALYEDLTAAENLAFAFRMRGKKADPGEIARLLDRVALAPHADARVRAFSSGMRRRVALARVMIEPPRLLLLDEPYASFDPEGIALVNSLVTEVKAAGGAVLVATHDLESARGVVQRVIRMEAGVLFQVEQRTDEADRAQREGAVARGLHVVEGTKCP